MKKILLATAFMTLAYARLATAQTNPSDDLFVDLGNNSFENLASVIASFLIGLCGIVAVLYLIIGGYQYLTSGANPDLAKRGAKTVTHAIIGLIIVILSYIIVQVVVSSLVST